MDLASFAPALQTGAAVATGASLLLAHTTTGLVVPDGTGTLVSSGQAVGIGLVGSQDHQHQDSEEGEQVLDLHHIGKGSHGAW